MMLRLWALGLLVLGVAGCGGFEERATQIQFNSTPRGGHPLFKAFVGAAMAQREAIQQKAGSADKAAA